jgi:hypothetical protein
LNTVAVKVVGVKAQKAQVERKAEGRGKRWELDKVAGKYPLALEVVVQENPEERRER